MIGKALAFLRDNAVALGALAAVISFSWPIWQYFDVRRQEHHEKEFKEYHRLIQELVESQTGTSLYLDRQAAIVFELRRYERYHEFSLRTLEGLKQLWCSDPQYKRLCDEMDLTIAYIRARAK
jgi:hypothetical protein